MKMKLMIAVALLGITGAASAQQYVNGYTRADGRYVQGYYRSDSNGTKLDNYSTQGNVNPYTGQSGTVDPYRPTQSNPYGSPYNQPRPQPRSDAGYRRQSSWGR